MYNAGFKAMCKSFIRRVRSAEDDYDWEEAYRGCFYFYSYLYAFGYTECRIDNFMIRLRNIADSTKRV